MRFAVLTLPLLLLCSCSIFSSEEPSTFTPPNSLMADEIQSRVDQIPYQHGQELVLNLMWLAQTGESTIPTLLTGLKHDNPKVRSSCAWTLGRIRDRRTIPYLQASVKDSNETVRLECARTLVTLGDVQQAPVLIEGLDSSKKEVRYMCHEALKTSTGRDFGYDHLSENETQRRTAVLGWRQWWAEYSGDSFFATSYQQKFLLQPAQPMGEGQMPQQDNPMPQEQTEIPPQQEPMPEPQAEPQTQPTPSNGGGEPNQSGHGNG